MNVEKSVSRSSIKTRLFAFGTLCAFVSGVGYVASEAYHAATDSFVAPIILSPDNDMVLTNKLKIAEILVERTKSRSELEVLDADITACDTALARLEPLRKAAADGLGWAKAVNATQTSAGVKEKQALEEQRKVLTVMVDKQRTLADEAKRNLEAGLISKVDYAKEVQALHQFELAALENDRSRVLVDAQNGQVGLARRSLRSENGAPTLPEALLREDQSVRIELEVLRLEAEKRGKIAERKVIEEKLAKIDEIELQLKGRPIFRAVERSMDVAFVPYTQLEGVERGGDVYDCVWGVLACKPVGKVAELVPGEVILPDPWGNQARGQYAVLDLKEHESAKSRTLRIRPAGSSQSKADPTHEVSVR